MRERRALLSCLVLKPGTLQGVSMMLLHKMSADTSGRPKKGGRCVSGCDNERVTRKTTTVELNQPSRLVADIIAFQSEEIGNNVEINAKMEIKQKYKDNFFF